MFSSFFKSVPMKKYIVSYIIAFLFTVVVLSALSVVFAFYPPSQAVLSAVCDYCGIFSAFVAALLCSHKSTSRGYLVGMISACIYTCILMGIGCLLWGRGALPQGMASYLIIASIAGAAGGITGINLK